MLTGLRHPLAAGLPAAGQDPRYASPGVLGFLVVFFLAVATWLLIRSMVGHLRKVRYSAEAAERAAVERAGAEGAGNGTPAERQASEEGPRPTPGPDAGP